MQASNKFLFDTEFKNPTGPVTPPKPEDVALAFEEGRAQVEVQPVHARRVVCKHHDVLRLHAVLPRHRVEAHPLQPFQHGEVPPSQVTDAPYRRVGHDGQPVEDITANALSYELGSDGMVPGFDDAEQDEQQVDVSIERDEDKTAKV